MDWDHGERWAGILGWGLGLGSLSCSSYLSVILCSYSLMHFLEMGRVIVIS